MKKVYKKNRPNKHSGRKQHKIILILTLIRNRVKYKIFGFTTFLAFAGIYAAFAACETGLTEPLTCLWTSLFCIAGFVFFGNKAGIFLKEEDFK